MTIMYGLRVFLYALASSIIGYITVYIVPILTPLGGIVETGIIFFTGLLIHELVAYRNQKEKFQTHQLHFSLQTEQLNKALYLLQQSLIDTVRKLRLPLPKLPFLEEIEDLEKLLKKKELNSKNFIQLLDLQIQILHPLVQTISTFTPPTFESSSQNPLSPTVCQKTLPNNDGPNFPKFSLHSSFDDEKETPSLSSTNENILKSSFKPETKSFHSYAQEEQPNVIPFSYKSTPSFVDVGQNPILKKSNGEDISSGLTKKYILEQVNNALNNNHFDMMVDKIFDLSSKKNVLKRCFPFITLTNNKQILYNQFIDISAEENIQLYIDHASLGKVLQMAKDSHHQTSFLQYLCGVHINSLINPDFIDTYIEFSGSYPELCARVIFEINYVHFNKLSYIEHLQKLALKGFNFALFSAHLELPKDIISALPFYYYLTDALQITQHLHNSSSFSLIQSVKSFLSSHHTEMIMLNVNNDEKIVSTFLSSGITCGQGSFFTPSSNQLLR